MKKVLLCTLLVLSIVMLTACGSKLKEAAGTYVLEYSKFVGDPDTAKNTTEYADLILNADGTGKSNRNNATYDVEWSLDGEEVKLTEIYLGIKLEYNGTLKDGKLDLFNGDKTNALTNETVYNKK